MNRTEAPAANTVGASFFCIFLLIFERMFDIIEP